MDVYIPSIKTGIEYDGKRWHKNIKNDLMKDKYCHENGIRLIRIRESGLPLLNSTSVIFETIPNKDNHIELEKCIIKVLSFLNINNIEVNIDKDNDEILELMQLSRKKDSLLDLMPSIVEIWDKEKNGDLTPDMFSKCSEKQIWVICKRCGKSFQSKVKDIYLRRTMKCSDCAHYRLKKGINDFKTKYPNLALEYDYKKNNRKLEDLELGESKEKYWWKCSKCGNEWKASIASRIKSIYCPKCASPVGAKTRTLNKIKKEGSLATNYPDIAKEWHPTKNGNLTPTEMTCKNKKIIWWKCSKCGYEWQNSVALRTKGFGRCKNCEAKK